MNSQEKFYDTYGKNASFESELLKKDEPETSQETSSPSRIPSVIKKYAIILLGIVLIGGFLLIGGIFLMVFLAISIIGFIIRSLFFPVSPGNNGIMKK